MTAMSMLSETAERPYFFRKVIRKPNPMKIITCTSWNTDQGRREMTTSEQGTVTNIMIL